MTPLILKRASLSRQSGQWRDGDYDVLEDGVIVGRIRRIAPWTWASGHNGDIKRAAHGYEPTREAATAAFAKSWRRGAWFISVVRCLMGVMAPAVVTTMFVLPADARTNKQKRPAAVQTQQPPSLDGRTLGRMRTCGFDYLQYDGMGTPYGPYCH